MFLQIRHTGLVSPSRQSKRQSEIEILRKDSSICRIFCWLGCRKNSCLIFLQKRAPNGSKSQCGKLRMRNIFWLGCHAATRAPNRPLVSRDVTLTAQRVSRFFSQVNSAISDCVSLRNPIPRRPGILCNLGSSSIIIRQQGSCEFNGPSHVRHSPLHPPRGLQCSRCSRSVARTVDSALDSADPTTDMREDFAHPITDHNRNTSHWVQVVIASSSSPPSPFPHYALSPPFNPISSSLNVHGRRPQGLLPNCLYFCLFGRHSKTCRLLSCQSRPSMSPLILLQPVRLCSAILSVIIRS